MAIVMALNAGSSSLKFQLIEMPAETEIAAGVIDRIGLESSTMTVKFDGNKHKAGITALDHGEALKAALQAFLDLNIIPAFDVIVAVGHRVVQGADRYKGATLVTDAVIADIEDLAELAPLHNRANALGMRAVMELLPGVPQVAVFDTAFHQSIPAKNYLYALPYKYYEEFGIRKYGYHGTSVQFVSSEAAKAIDKPFEEAKVIVAHLGAGSSVTAVDHGKSLDTSMGMSPVAGLMMATRVGDIDPSVTYFLQEKTGMSNEEVVRMMNKESGWYGVSEISEDMREIEDTMNTNPRAMLTMEMFAERAISYVGSFMAKLNGADVIAFSGGVGENSPIVREMIMRQLKYMGIEIDEEVNNATHGKLKRISTDASTVPVYVVPTNEELAIVRDTYRLTK